MVTTSPEQPESGQRPVRIEEEMRTSYLTYAMSVIVSRALPDVRDGLKPVHRRILYAMHDMGIRPGGAYRKSARIAGEVLGKFHPHGEGSVYNALVRLAQDFSLRYPLITGQGNFGSIDGDPPAAMRYTEARLAPIAEELLADIDQNTLDFSPNFDDSIGEPTVLPARLPNMLINGASGIAVGMATNIPPHNLGEICDAIVRLIENPDTTTEQLMRSVKGPDFPTGANILGHQGIFDTYPTGRGRIIMEATTEIEEIPGSRDREQIIITELPYQVNKANLVEKIANLTREKKLEGISDIRDESDRHGMRVVIELRRDAQPYVVMNNQIYGLTTGQVSPTSSIGMTTKSTPFGNVEQPINPITSAIMNGATFVARAYSGDVRHMSDIFQQGIRHKGFSIIDVFSPCVTFNLTNTHDFFKERVKKLEDEGHDTSDWKTACEKAMLFGDTIYTGLFFQKQAPTLGGSEPVLEPDQPLGLQTLGLDKEQTKRIIERMM